MRVVIPINRTVSIDQALAVVTAVVAKGAILFIGPTGPVITGQPAIARHIGDARRYIDTAQFGRTLPDGPWRHKATASIAFALIIDTFSVFAVFDGATELFAGGAIIVCFAASGLLGLHTNARTIGATTPRNAIIIRVVDAVQAVGTEKTGDAPAGLWDLIAVAWPFGDVEHISGSQSKAIHVDEIRGSGRHGEAHLGLKPVGVVITRNLALGVGTVARADVKDRVER